MNLMLLFISILNIYETMILIYVIMSWVPESRTTKLGQVLANLVEPYLSIFRKIIPPLGMIDFSPLIAFLLLQFAIQGLYRLF
ncbi:MAG: YggT family protein [Turicibacter sp.]